MLNDITCSFCDYHWIWSLLRLHLPDIHPVNYVLFYKQYSSNSNTNFSPRYLQWLAFLFKRFNLNVIGKIQVFVSDTRNWGEMRSKNKLTKHKLIRLVFACGCVLAWAIWCVKCYLFCMYMYLVFYKMTYFFCYAESANTCCQLSSTRTVHGNWYKCTI